ncbi:MAG: hypothetical protein L0211_18150 [Planctomycetaceae bacterium]|nr:hypothetical protein [Planctomycetaceae bacterium]
MTAGTRLQESLTPVATSPAARGWLFGPWLDALLVANVAWPVLLLAQWTDGFSGQAGLQFWQLYFITTPHRWITLALVFLDRERLGERWQAFLAVAGMVVVVCLGVRLSTGALTCLLAVDYVWNAWHFAAQHHGIYRIYGRLSEPSRTSGLFLEKWSLRLFLLYVILRVAGATWSHAELESWLATIDWLVVVVPLGIVFWDLARATSASLGRTLYLVSVCTLFLAMLWAVHTSRPRLVLSLATASALFHAIEYLTLVGWSVARRHGTLGDRMGILGYLAPRWAIALAIFVVILGSSGWLLDQHLLAPWLFLNVIVAFLHYAYDGMIWRGGPAGGSSHAKA